MAGWEGVGACFATSTSFVLTVVSQFLYVNLGRGPTFTFHGLVSLSLWCLVRVTRWHLLSGMALGLSWYDLMEKRGGDGLSLPEVLHHFSL